MENFPSQIRPSGRPFLAPVREQHSPRRHLVTPDRECTVAQSYNQIQTLSTNSLIHSDVSRINTRVGISLDLEENCSCQLRSRSTYFVGLFNPTPFQQLQSYSQTVNHHLGFGYQIQLHHLDCELQLSNYSILIRNPTIVTGRPDPYIGFQET